MEDTIPMEDSTEVIAFESTARMSAMQAPLELTPIFTLEYDGQRAEVAHTINTMVQYVRIIIDTVTHGHPSERPPEDEGGWKPLPL
jgi:hypothetical protein